LTAAGRWTRFNVRVTNTSDYDEAIFEAAPDLDPCGLNANSSRTWVDIADAGTGQRIYGFCALHKPSEMADLWFAVAVGQLPPKAVTVSLHDRRTDQQADSAPVDIPLGDGFTIAWKAHSPDFGQDTIVSASAVIDDRIVVIGSAYDVEIDDFRPAIWWEDGDLVWRRATVPATTGEATLSAIFAGGPGLVVVGTESDETGLLWLSADGKEWQAADPTGLNGSVWTPGPSRVGMADGGVIVLGRFGEPFVSQDGRDWRTSGDQATREMALGAEALAGSGSELTAFSKHVDPAGCGGGDVTGDLCTGGPVLVWRSSGPESWSMVGELPDSTDTTVMAAAVGPRGWVAIGEGIAWHSANGITWEKADGPPQYPSPLGEVLLFGTNAGFVGVGAYFVDQCAVDGGYMETVTWTSSDGRVWRVADTIEGPTIASLRRRGETLIALGTYDWLGGASSAVWTAALPKDSSDGDPPQTPAPLPTSEMCEP
jgi:hypothetical protein